VEWYECNTVIVTGTSGRSNQTQRCAAAEREKLTKERDTAMAVATDPAALWANWLRGTVKLPVGIGDVRQYQDRIRQLESELELHSFSLSPAMVQARNDQLNEEVAKLTKERDEWMQVDQLTVQKLSDTAFQAGQAEGQLVGANTRIKRLEEAVEWTLGMNPSPCRCISFATPPHVCIAHRALGSAGVPEAKEAKP
jgi:hypothetical protein